MNPSLQLNLTEGVTPISHDIYSLHMTVIWVCVAIGIVVFGTLIHSIIYYRKSNGKAPAVFHEKLWLEVTWTVIPTLILIALAIPGTRVLMHMDNYEASDITIKVTAYQWKWRYEYLDQGINFFSNLATSFDERNGKIAKNINYLREVDHPLIVPIHKKIRFLVTSNDVLHSFWVPDLGVKREAVPGFINESWARINRPGTYRGQCTELCGVNHAFMPIVVKAVSEKEFNDWITQQKGGIVIPAPAIATPAPVTVPSAATTITAPTSGTKKTLEEQMKQGEQIFLTTCAVCHKPDGTGMPPTYPALKGDKTTLGPLNTHIDTVMNGHPGTAMQAFKDQFNDEELAGVITYERNAWGNNKGDIVQPEQIAALRK